MIYNDRGKFNVVYMDYEFAKRYRAEIENLPPDWIKSIFQPRRLIADAIVNLLFPSWAKDIPESPITPFVPVQFDFNEILLNPRGVLTKDLHDRANKLDWSYGDFELGKLLGDGVTRVAVWRWYLPSLLHFLLSSRNATVSQIHSDLKSGDAVLGKEFENYVRNLCNAAKDNRDRLMICESMQDLQEVALSEERFNAGVVLGSGSSVLVDRGKHLRPGSAGGTSPHTLQEGGRRGVDKAGTKHTRDFRHIKAVVPMEQGVFVWINCAAAISRVDRGPATAVIDHWLENATQASMFERARSAGYYGLPVNKDILNEKIAKNPQLHAVKTFKRLCEPSWKPTQKMPRLNASKVLPRVLPPQHWGWVHLWEEFVRAAKP